MRTVTDLTRPIVGIETRSAQEVFEIMCDRIRGATASDEQRPLSDDEYNAMARRIMRQHP